MNKNKEICAECGNSVKFGSGRFVNRVPILDNYQEKKLSNRPYPEGEYICPICEEKIYNEFKKEI